MIPVLERLAHVHDVREYIPKISGKTTVSYYEAFRILKAPRETSPLDNILSSWSNLKKNAKAFFSGNAIDEDSKEERKSSDDDSIDYKVVLPVLLIIETTKLQRQKNSREPYSPSKKSS